MTKAEAKSSRETKLLPLLLTERQQQKRQAQRRHTRNHRQRTTTTTIPSTTLLPLLLPAVTCTLAELHRIRTNGCNARCSWCRRPARISQCVGYAGLRILVTLTLLEMANRRIMPFHNLNRRQSNPCSCPSIMAPNHSAEPGPPTLKLRRFRAPSWSGYEIRMPVASASVGTPLEAEARQQQGEIAGEMTMEITMPRTTAATMLDTLQSTTESTKWSSAATSHAPTSPLPSVSTAWPSSMDSSPLPPTTTRRRSWHRVTIIAAAAAAKCRIPSHRGGLSARP